jgi:hypothetical protein
VVWDDFRMLQSENGGALPKDNGQILFESIQKFRPFSNSMYELQAMMTA